MTAAPVTRTITAAELAEVLGWAAEEGWNPGLDDAAAFHAADPEGFFVTLAGDQPVAAISVVNHDEGMAFLGLYLCRPAFRGRGIGFALWGHALAHAGGRTVGLDGVAAQQQNYARSGFVLAGATARWEGRIGAPAPGVRRLGPGDLRQVMALDRAASGYDRGRFLAAWLAPAATRASFVSGDGRGFATARLCREGCKIGPVVAPDAGAALGLIAAGADWAGAAPVIVDVPEANRELSDRLAGLGFAASFRTARMYRGPAPVAGPGLQAVGTLELG